MGNICADRKIKCTICKNTIRNDKMYYLYNATRKCVIVKQKENILWTIDLTNQKHFNTDSISCSKTCLQISCPHVAKYLDAWDIKIKQRRKMHDKIHLPRIDDRVHQSRIDRNNTKKAELFARKIPSEMYPRECYSCGYCYKEKSSDAAIISTYGSYQCENCQASNFCHVINCYQKKDINTCRMCDYNFCAKHWDSHKPNVDISTKYKFYNVWDRKRQCMVNTKHTDVTHVHRMHDTSYCDEAKRDRSKYYNL